MDKPGTVVKYADIAKAAGVSAAKVCRALGDRGGITPSEAERIRNIAASMGYRGNRLASSVKTGRSRIIGCLINHLTNPYNNEIMAGMESAAASHDHIVIFLDGTDQLDLKLRRLLAYKVDALILTYTPAGSEAEALSGMEPFLGPRLCSQETIRPGWGEVSVDHGEATIALVDYLYDLGHRRIAFACGLIPDERDNARLAGYMRGLKRNGITVRRDYILVGEDYPDVLEGGAAAGAALMRMPERPTAVIAHNDTSAMGILITLRNSGLCVPGDISVCGFDGLSLFSTMKPVLTTIDTHNKEWGKRLVEAAVQMVEGGSPIIERHRWDLRLGETTGPVA